MTIQTLEELSLNAWPALQTKLYDGWILRFAGGYTKRSNSINPLYHSTLPFQEKLDYCEKAYLSMNLPPIFKLTSGSVPGELDRGLGLRGYRRLDETSVRTLALQAWQPRKPSGVIIEERFTDTWHEAFANLASLPDEKTRLIARRILKNITGPVLAIRKVAEGQTVGCGYGAIERDWVGIFDIIVAAPHRGRGYGRAIMEGLLNAAVERGVAKAYLSVVVGNTPAENLYHQLGFQEAYRYWYRKSPLE